LGGKKGFETHAKVRGEPVGRRMGERGREDCPEMGCDQSLEVGIKWSRVMSILRRCVGLDVTRVRRVLGADRSVAERLEDVND